ncbi:hypothetical protein [Mycobacterium leprae]|uniref:hypothetical protein n=1 Tax=Mycobacterium leprae TaxID=1769 RepID=UPI0002F6F10F|nr:hypothetical protein [Mycobacterium leprae]
MPSSVDWSTQGSLSCVLGFEGLLSGRFIDVIVTGTLLTEAVATVDNKLERVG